MQAKIRQIGYGQVSDAKNAVKPSFFEDRPLQTLRKSEKLCAKSHSFFGPQKGIYRGKGFDPFLAADRLRGIFLPPMKEDNENEAL